MPENATAEPTATAQQWTAARNVRLPTRHHAERQGRSRRTRTLPPGRWPCRRLWAPRPRI